MSKKSALMFQMKHNILKNESGLRDLSLRKNKFSNVFARLLQNCLKFDSYIKCIDLSHNRIGKKELNALLDSNSLT